MLPISPLLPPKHPRRGVVRQLGRPSLLAASYSGNAAAAASAAIEEIEDTLVGMLEELNRIGTGTGRRVFGLLWFDFAGGLCVGGKGGGAHTACWGSLAGLALVRAVVVRGQHHPIRSSEPLCLLCRARARHEARLVTHLPLGPQQPALPAVQGASTA